MPCCKTLLFDQILGQLTKYLSAEDKDNITDWAFAKNAIASLKDLECDCCIGGFREDIQTFWKIFKLLMDSFEQYNLNDLNIPVSLMHYGYEFLLEYTSCQSHTEQQSFCSAATSEYMFSESDLRRLMKLTYSVHRIPTDYTLIVWTLVEQGKLLLLTSLLRYGVMYLPMENTECEWQLFLKNLDWKFFSKKNESFRGFSWDSLSDFRANQRTLTVFRIVLLLALTPTKRRNDSDEEGPERKRHRLWFDRYSCTSQSSRFQCLEMVFRTIPEPFVTTKEIEEVLKMGYVGQEDEETEMNIDSILSYFEQFYPQGANCLAPRSLKHLSRCQVRDNLRLSGTLPYGVHSLEVHDSLKKYILLEE